MRRVAASKKIFTDMKVSLNPASLSTVLGVAIFGVASFGGNAIAQTKPANRESLPNIDARIHVEQPAEIVDSHPETRKIVIFRK